MHHFAAALRDDHSSSPGLAAGIQQPTRGFILPGSLRHREGSALAFAKHSSSRASSPLLFGLAPRGVCHALDITAEAVGSYPTFSPLPASRTFEDVPKVFLRDITALRAAGGIVSVALSVNSSTGFSLCFFSPYLLPAAPSQTHCRSFTDSSLCYRPPGITRRIALHPQASRPKGFLCSRRVVSGLSSRPVRLRVPGQRSSSSPATPIISRDLPRFFGLFHRGYDYFALSSFSNSPSVSTVTPNSFALSYFDPGSVPTTT